MAYGTQRYGVNVAAGDIDSDGFAEILTGPGPGAIFGPHVRAFNYDGASPVVPVPGVNFIAYNTQQWGVNVSSGDIDGDGYAEILTGPGPGVSYGPHVRGWNVDDGSTTAIRAVSFFAYGVSQFGAVVASGELDGDGFAEIITAPGPGEFFSAHIRGWNYDDSSIRPLPGYNFPAWPSTYSRYGARIFTGTDLDLNGHDELVASCGPDPSIESPVKVFKYDGAHIAEWFSFQAFPSAR